MNYPHGDLLKRKVEEKKVPTSVLNAYLKFTEQAEAIEVIDDESVSKLVDALNQYRNEAVYIFEGGKNVPQANLRSSIMEEFLIWLFKDIFKVLNLEKPDNYQIGKSKGSYLSLDFSPRSFRTMFSSPGASIHTKDQDFALGANIEINIKGAGESEVVQRVTLPVIAIECKTYLAKNHLDMCSSTATSLRRAMPYCKYIILAEFLKLSNTATPEFTDVSEIFVMCKAKNTERIKRKKEGLPPHPIYGDVAIALFKFVLSHLSAIWWDPKSPLETGVVISRPT
jgi:hypothetical protein